MKSENIKIKIISFLLFAICYCVATSFAYLLFAIAPARAQESLRTFTIVPPTVSQTLDPGGRAEGVMKVINDSNNPLTFTASIHDFIVDNTVGTPNLLPPNTLSKKFSAAAWLGVTPNTFTILPHQKQTLNYYLQVPADARPGGHYAAVVFSPATTMGVKGTGASVETKLGTLFYISVNGPIKEQSLIAKFLANAFQEYSPVTIFTQIRNSGDLHIRPTGKIELTDVLGRTVETQSLSEFNIYPGAARDFENLFGKDKPMFGRYQVSFLAAYGKNNNLPLLATLYFWVIPWKLITIAVLIIVAVALAVMYWRKKKVNTPPTTNDVTSA